VAAGVLATAGYYLLPGQSIVSTVVYDLIGFLAGVAMLVGVRLFRPARPAMWYWFAAGQFMSVLGDVIWSIYVFGLDRSPYPSIADVFYLAAYPMLIIGLVLLIRGRGRSDMAHLIDAAIVATGLGLLFWVFVLQPILADSSAPWLDRVISAAYPTTDVWLLALLARLYTDAGRRNSSARMLGVATVLLLIADVSYSLMTLNWETDPRPLDGLFLLSYVLWAAAGLHPSMAADTDAVTPERNQPVGMVRLAVFGACSLVAPVMLFVPGVGDDTADRLAVGFGAIVLFLLVIARMAGVMRRVQRQSGELELLAMRDDLTGLANRRQFELALRDALGGGRPQIALLGLNGFKNVNDELGRPIGDRVLGLLAGRIVNAAPGGALVARIGGDEFAVLLTDADAGSARTMAVELAGALRAPVRTGGHELLVGVGIGLAGGTGLDAVEVMRQGEAAMYAAKQTGEPYRRWSPALDDRAGEHAQLGAEMRAALDTGQFRVVYQPIVEMPAGRVAAVEALVRWEHPERGLISPAHFVPVAERNGLIVELGEWILRTACDRLAGWRAELGTEAPNRVSVNVSARQLARPGFARTVAAALAASGLPPECLAVEVTETAVFEGGQAVTTLHELRALGVWIALDDFGTGHSSLGLLQTVPVDILKVDKSFVDRITEAGRHAVIAEALIQVSTGLGLTAVAEGVETAEQAAALQQLGYQLLQGYHFGRPVADPDFALVRATAAADLVS
jgi:diguanylate cyclase (GGDEF)-like protein